MSDEREMLAAGLPPEDDAAWAEFEAKVLGKRADCPPTGDLIELAEGPSAPGAADKLRGHIKGCDYCRTVFEAYQHALREPAEAAGVPREGSLLAQVAAEVATRSPRPVQQVELQEEFVSLFRKGVSATSLLEQTKLEPIVAIQKLCEARDYGMLRVEPQVEGQHGTAWGIPKWLKLVAPIGLVVGILVFVLIREVHAHRQAETILSLVAEKAKSDARLLELEKELQAVGITQPYKLDDPQQVFGIVHPDRNRLKVAGEFKSRFIKEVRLRWGNEPDGTFTVIPGGGVTLGHDAKPIRFEKTSPELRLRGDTIVAVLEFVPYAEIKERFPHFFTSDLMHFTRTFRLSKEGIVANPDPVAVTEPKQRQTVGRTENLEGRISIPGGHPIILVKAAIASEWHVQPAVEEIKDGDFTAQVYFGAPGPQPIADFQLLVVVAPSREQALKQFREGTTLRSLPVGLPRSRIITVTRDRE